MLDDRLSLRSGRVHVAPGVAGVRLCLAPGLTLEGGGEEERLAILRHLGHDAVDGRLEAHVEHPVRLVEHEHLHVLERDVAALEEVLQATGGGHHDVRPGGELGLSLESHASVHHCDGQGAGVGHAFASPPRSEGPARAWERAPALRAAVPRHGGGQRAERRTPGSCLSRWVTARARRVRRGRLRSRAAGRRRAL